MNRGRIGGQYCYPDSFIRLQGSIRACFLLPYRQLEGFTRALSKWEPRREVPDYLTTCRRVNRLDIGLEPRLNPDEPVTLAVDASGIKVADRGEWIRTKWRRRRGFLKIHIAVNIETKQIVAVEATDERTGDGRMLKPLVEQAQRHCRIEKVLLDGAYDSRENFAFLDERGIEAAIKVRRSSSCKARGCPARKRVVLEYLRARRPRSGGSATADDGWPRPRSPPSNNSSANTSWPDASQT